ncbi:MAG: diguanylate cyclase [Candidatus Melainabacteria bacterium]|nr:diguanylate cyclase [Candidatus Melainabacteria bacterium]
MKNQFSQILKSYSAELAFLRPPSIKDGEGAKQKRRLELTYIATVVTALLLIAAGLFWEYKIELIVLAAIVIGLLVYLFRIQARFLRQHEDYETKLHTMASTIEERNRELKRLVLIDPLTEVMNRRGFERALAVETNRAKRNGTQNFALLIDCDDFKGINEKYGHSVGDIVLQELSSRLQIAVRPTDQVARIGGDEFLILLTEVNQSTAFQIAERVRLAVAETPINLSNGTTKITTSTGVTQLSSELLSIEEILASANAGLKSSKQSGKNTVSFSQISHEKNELTQILEDLRSGTSLRTVYQPISQLHNQHIVAYELQCRGPAGVFEQPDAFYKLAREHNLRTAIDLRCLKLCLENMDKLPDKSACHIKICPSTLLDVPVESIEEMFKSNGREVCLTISDHEFLAEPLCLKEHIDKLRELGVTIAIDRIGYGFSSLDSLLFLGPQYLKLDKELVEKCRTDELHLEFVKKLVKVVSQLDCSVIADGIAAKDDLQIMITCGVDYGQGVFWGMPIAT